MGKYLPKIILFLLLIFWEATGQAQVFDVPRPSLKKGEIAGGVALADFKRKIRPGSGKVSNVDYSRETLFADYGLQDDATLRVELSTVDLDNFRGEEIGVGYRGAIGKTSKLGEGGLMLEKGYFGSIRSANLSVAGSSADFIQIDLGAGGVIRINEMISAYFAGLYSRLNGTFDKTDFEGDSSLGLYGGGVVDLDKTLRLGVELHLIFETNIGFFARMTF